MSFGSAVAERSQKGESPGHEVVSPPVKVGGESLVQRDASRTAVSLMQSGTGSDGVRRERTPAEIEAEIKRDHKIRQEHLSSSLSGKILVSGEDPRPKGLRQAHEELEKDDLFWMKYLLGGSSALQSFLNDVLGGTRLLHFQVLEATIRDQDFFLPWADRLDNMVAVIMLAQRVWFEGNWANGYLKQATSWSDLNARMTSQMASAGSGSSTAGLQAMQARLNGLQVLAGLGRGVRSGSAMASVHTANDGWKTAPEPPPIAQADAAKPGGQSGNVAGNVASNYTVTQEATRAQTIAKLNGSATATTVANAPPERTALETVGHYAMLTALAPLAGAYHLLSGGGHDWSGGMADEAKGMPGDFTTNLEKVQDRRTAAWEERERAQAGSMQSEIPATLNLYECPMSEGTLARLMQIWNKGWWFNYGEAELAQIREFRGMLSAINAKYKHLTDVEFRKPRTAESAAAFSWYDNAGTWVHLWAGRLERGLELWGGARGATIRRIGPNAKNWSQLEAAMKAKVEADAAKPEGWFGLSDAQDAVVDAKRGIENFVALNREGPHDYHKEEWALTKDSGSNNRSGKLLPQV